MRLYGKEIVIQFTVVIMKPFKHRLKINSKTTQKPKETTDQLKIGSDHAYQKMIRRVLDEVLPEH